MINLIEPALLPLSLFVTIILVLFVCQIIWSKRKLIQFAAQLPGPAALPFIGNGLDFLCKQEELLDVFIKSTVPYGSPSRLWLGPKLIIFVQDPQQIQTVLQLSKITHKAFVYKFLEPFLGNGLFTSSGDTHKYHRKILQPLFGQRCLEGYCHLFQKHANLLVKTIKTHVDGPEFDLILYLHDTTIAATMDILFEDENDHSIDNKEISKYIRRTKMYKDQLEILNVMKIMIEEVMKTKVPDIVERILYNNYNNVQTNELRLPSMLNMIIEMLMENADCLTVEDTIDNLMTFFAASQDTQASAIAFTCMMLGCNPEIQDKVINEIQEVLGDRKEMDIHDISKMKYLEMCIKESLRLFPVAPMVFRDTTEEFKLNKHVIPIGATVSVPLFNIHRDPKYWAKHDQFYPEHFTPEAIANRHPYCFIPFSSGPRKCIAQQYSYTNMKIIIATILLNYKVESKRQLKDIKLTTDISIRPIGGYLMKITNRN